MIDTGLFFTGKCFLGASFLMPKSGDCCQIGPRSAPELTKIKTSKIIVIFWPKVAGKNLVLIFFKCGISCHFGLQFLLRYLYNQYFLLLNVFLIQNLIKAHWQCQFLCFFITLDLILTIFCPKDQTHFTFFGWFPMKYARGFN